MVKEQAWNNASHTNLGTEGSGGWLWDDDFSERIGGVCGRPPPLNEDG